MSHFFGGSSQGSASTTASGSRISTVASSSTAATSVDSTLSRSRQDSQMRENATRDAPVSSGHHSRSGDYYYYYSILAFLIHSVTQIRVVDCILSRRSHQLKPNKALEAIQTKGVEYTVSTTLHTAQGQTMNSIHLFLCRV